MRKHQRNRAIGGALFAGFLLAALLGRIWTPFDPLRIDLRSKLQAPGGAHWLGTDEFGRDVLSRLMAAAGSSVSISLTTVCFAILAGVFLGVLAGYTRGWTDRVIMSFNDALLAFPSMLLALALLSITGANMYGIILALGMAYTPSVVRVVRGSVLSLREREFIEASRIMGNSAAYTMFRHILPNCMAPVIVLATSMFGSVLLTESALSFLGLGVPPPAPTWGNMLASARPHMAEAVWLGIFPGLCISLTLLGINLFGDAIRDRFDPRMRGL
ncbi:ABC transporter permease [Rhizobiaceae bacterium BDR2-2]|uniref:ABC transporter permease n=1 Tax=Ectorhizobium quercum TaxID=2965071 RepID=A0AAE3MX49_9HYPH|nr:ABC transporter permease [Ectorhizobium quercum]MCX8995896.1 ABC transporter permease [Ectorhizobium quercum]